MALVRSAYSEYEETFMAATKIQQADLSRYMIVHHYGGFYAGTVCVCARVRVRVRVFSLLCGYGRVVSARLSWADPH